MNGCIWTRLKDSQMSRVNHQAVIFGDDMFIFGGYSNQEKTKSSQYHRHQIKVAIWDTRQNVWTALPYSPVHMRHVNGADPVNWSKLGPQVAESGYVDPEPCMRYGHTLVQWEGWAWMWGGRTDSDVCDALLYAFDVNRAQLWRNTRRVGSPPEKWWHRIVGDSGFVPAARDGHAAAVLADCMYIFGGYVAETDSYDNSLYQLNLVTFQWTRMGNFSGAMGPYPHAETSGLNDGGWGSQAPSPRDFSSLCAHQDRLFLIGGRSISNEGEHHYSNEWYDPALWEFCLPGSTYAGWHQVCSGSSNARHKTTAPLGRRSACFWGYRGGLYLCFGLNGHRQQHLNDLWRYDLSHGSWQSLSVVGGVCPTPRRRAVGCLHQKEPRVFIYGGTQPVQLAEMDRTSGLDAIVGPEGDQNFTDFFIHDDEDGDEMEDVVDINGSELPNQLKDIKECYVLDLEVTLYRLCLHRVIQLGVNTDLLPDTIIDDINKIHPSSRSRKLA